MYYIYGVAPGTYYLEVRVLPLGALYTYRSEARSQPYTDVAPLVVPSMQKEGERAMRISTPSRTSPSRRTSASAPCMEVELG